jgi:uncharacterized protein involved in exopolysaccharide biosynthesis
MTKKLASAMSEKLELERKYEAERRSREQLLQSFESSSESVSIDSSDNDSEADATDEHIRIRNMRY